MVERVIQLPLSRFMAMQQENHPDDIYESWRFRCTVCGNTFETCVSNGNFSKVSCPHCAREKEQERIKAESMKSYYENLESKYGIPKDNAYATLDTFSIRTDPNDPSVEEGDRHALYAMQELKSALSSTMYNPYILRNVTLCGTTGVGKSFLGAAIMKEAIKMKLKNGCMYITDAALMGRVSAAWKSKTKSEKDIKEEFAGYSLLVIDDVNPERWTKKGSGFLVELLEDRFKALDQTVMLSNLKMSQFLSSFGYDPAVSRLKLGRIVQMTGEDRRKLQKIEQKRRMEAIA